MQRYSVIPTYWINELITNIQSLFYSLVLHLRYVTPQWPHTQLLCVRWQMARLWCWGSSPLADIHVTRGVNKTNCFRVPCDRGSLKACLDSTHAWLSAVASWSREKQMDGFIDCYWKGRDLWALWDLSIDPLHEWLLLSHRGDGTHCLVKKFAYLKLHWPIHCADAVVSCWMLVPFALAKCFVPSARDPLFTWQLHFQRLDDSGQHITFCGHPSLSKFVSPKNERWLLGRQTMRPWPEVTWGPWSTGASFP